MISKKQHTTNGKLKYNSSSQIDVFDTLLKNKKFIKASRNKGKEHNVIFSKVEIEEELQDE
jgi:hypothetical protein